MFIKKLLVLFVTLIGMFMMGGCADDQPAPRTVYTAPVYVAPPAPYGDPYYVYGGVNYYYGGGRYWYYRHNHPVYVGVLPGGGVYWHRGGRYYHERYRHY